MVKYRELTADERTRDMYERREKARRDQEMWKKWERQQGLQEGRRGEKLEIARNLLGMKLSYEQIVKATGLTLAEVESLCGAE